MINANKRTRLLIEQLLFLKNIVKDGHLAIAAYAQYNTVKKPRKREHKITTHEKNPFMPICKDYAKICIALRALQNKNTYKLTQQKLK